MTSDWQNRTGKTQENAPLLAPMDLNKEHVFELVDITFQDGVTESYKGVTKTVNKVKMVWKEADKEKDFHRVWANFNEFYTEKSNLMKFLISASGKPYVAGVVVHMGDFLTERHRIKAMLKARIGKDGLPNGYYDFIPATIKPAGSLTIAKPAEINAQSTTDAVVMAYTHARGAKTFDEAYMRIAETKGVTTQQVAAFVAADKAGQIKYPIP